MANLRSDRTQTALSGGVGAMKSSDVPATGALQFHFWPSLCSQKVQLMPGFLTPPTSFIYFRSQKQSCRCPEQKCEAVGRNKMLSARATSMLAPDN
ncbi:MAG: hypothetical protein WBA88_16185 [Pseudaminobacter sp.]|jgi:hypothetical protein